MDKATQAALRYFEQRYPERDPDAPQEKFRKDEEGRSGALEQLLPRHADSICDIGCGDGLLLASLLQRVQCRPSHIHLVELSARFLGLAQHNLVSSGAAITTENCAVAECAEQTFDVVLAIGVSDYVADWSDLLSRLIARAGDTLLVDFPKSTPPRHILRRLWLRLHGIQLHTIARAALVALLDRYPIEYRIVDSRYNHIVKIQKARRENAS